MPCPCGVQTVMLAVCGRAATSVPWPRYQVCICTFRLGQAASAIQRPGLCRWVGAGGREGSRPIREGAGGWEVGGGGVGGCGGGGEGEVSSQIRKAAGETGGAAAGAASGLSQRSHHCSASFTKPVARPGHAS